MKNKRFGRLVATGSALGLAGVLVVAAPAFAASSSCTSISALKACTTGAVHANAAHDLRVVTSGLCTGTWRVFDTSNNKNIASGTNTRVNQVLHGVYASYKASMRSASGTVCNATIKIADI
ncbi:hypothetical protein [Microbispora sp. NPDC049125]|uniref:hypothetical protein n=1 Tax=Microbispora sp. NPDC049125 TaxID=3154929 RepID=UPI0034653F03